MGGTRYKLYLLLIINWIFYLYKNLLLTNHDPPNQQPTYL